MAGYRAHADGHRIHTRGDRIGSGGVGVEVLGAGLVDVGHAAIEVGDVGGVGVHLLVGRMQLRTIDRIGGGGANPTG
ncbi:hypothetical protein D9M71_278550 [compost metagenome]